MADNREAKRAKLVDALIWAKLTEEEKTLLWLPVVAKTRLAGL